MIFTKSRIRWLRSKRSRFCRENIGRTFTHHWKATIPHRFTTAHKKMFRTKVIAVDKIAETKDGW